MGLFRQHLVGQMPVVSYRARIHPHIPIRTSSVSFASAAEVHHLLRLFFVYAFFDVHMRLFRSAISSGERASFISVDVASFVFEDTELRLDGGR